MDGWNDHPKENMQEQIAMIRKGVMLLCYYGYGDVSLYCGEHAHCHRRLNIMLTTADASATL
eukprot:scaffold3437_cov145-Skeletonema_menzelii.AAC.11